MSFLVKNEQMYLNIVLMQKRSGVVECDDVVL